MMAKILLNPGPVTLSERVRRAATAKDYCHREPAFLRVQRQVIDGLGNVYGCDPELWTTVTLGGSGTTAMEAMLTSIVAAGEKVLVIENGVYGERMTEIARIHGIEVETLAFKWGQAVDLDSLDQALASGQYSCLAAVHHETTTGRLNPLQAFADVCERHGVLLLADTVSSFGAEAIPFDHGSLAACAGTANKCLHGIPGLAFVTLRRSLLQSSAPARSLYLHLPRWAAAQEQGSTPFTPPVNAYLALNEALCELKEQGGWQGRHLRYTTLADTVCQAFSEHGVLPWLPSQDSSCALRSYRLPKGLNYNEVHEGFENRDFIIYAGQGGLAGEMFRISTMGAISDDALEQLLETIRTIFQAL